MLGDDEAVDARRHIRGQPLGRGEIRLRLHETHRPVIPPRDPGYALVRSHLQEFDLQVVQQGPGGCGRRWGRRSFLGGREEA